MSDKVLLREHFLTKRLALNNEHHAAAVESMTLQFIEFLQNRDIKTIHRYIPIIQKKEFDTDYLKKQVGQEYPQIKWVVPRCNFRDRSMVHFIENNNIRLESTQYNLTEPTTGDEIAVDEIDIVITPLLCVDQRNYRLGYGAGFYDRFLANLDAIKVGFSFFPPVDALPVDRHDIPLDHVIFPQ